MNRETIQRRRAALETSIDLMQADLKSLPVPKCATCEFSGYASQCSKFDAVPPEYVQQAGCNQWQYDEIPF